MGSLLWTLIIGLVVGAIAKLLMPGKDPGGFIITILLGIAGAFVGTWIGRMVWGSNYVAGWILSVIGAMLLLLIYRMIASKRSGSPNDLETLSSGRAGKWPAKRFELQSAHSPLSRRG